MQRIAGPHPGRYDAAETEPGTPQLPTETSPEMLTTSHEPGDLVLSTWQPDDPDRPAAEAAASA
jgi:hypothetical protein